MHPHPPGRRVEFDPLEGVGVVAAVVDTAGGQLQASAVRIWGDYMKRLTLVQMTAQQQVPIEVQGLLGRAGVEFGQVVPCGQ